MVGPQNVEDAQGMEPVQFRPFAAAGEKKLRQMDKDDQNALPASRKAYTGASILYTVTRFCTLMCTMQVETMLKNETKSKCAMGGYLGRPCTLRDVSDELLAGGIRGLCWREDQVV